MAARLKAMGVTQYRNGFKVTLQHDALETPARWRKARVVFVNSMSDLFHERVPITFIRQVFAVMHDNERHTFQVLTKRPEVALKYASKLPWPENVWLGTSIENALYRHRASTLRNIPAKVRFLSLEPLLGPIEKLALRGIDWVIVGGESGPGARPMQAAWVRQIRDRCDARGVPFFFKQWGGVHKHRTGRLLDGRTWDEMPLPTGVRGSTNVRLAAAQR
jgi:protein gp37